MNNRNLNLNTLLPKLATICPLLGITLNVALHVIRTGSLVSLIGNGLWLVCFSQHILVFFAKICQKIIKTINEEHESKGFCVYEW